MCTFTLFEKQETKNINYGQKDYQVTFFCPTKCQTIVYHSTKQINPDFLKMNYSVAHRKTTKEIMTTSFNLLDK